MGLDVYSMATTRRAELERALVRRERLREAGFVTAPTLVSRLASAVGRRVDREREAQREIALPPIYCLTTRSQEPV